MVIGCGGFQEVLQYMDGGGGWLLVDRVAGCGMERVEILWRVWGGSAFRVAVAVGYQGEYGGCVVPVCAEALLGEFGEFG
jgi:hypothetical protein